MERWQRLYVAGMVAVFVLAIVGELIWLPDPLRFGERIYWIDTINVLAFSILAVPLFWLIGASFGIAEGLSPRRRQLALPGARRLSMMLPIRIAIAIASIIALVTLASAPRWLVLSAGLLGLIWLLSCTDMAIKEWQRTRRLPWRTFSLFLGSLAVLAILFWPTSYMVTYPGITLNMQRYATVEGGEAKGDIAGVLVFERPAFPIDWVYQALFSHYSFEPARDLGMTLGEYDRLVRGMKVNANELGSAVAFKQAGIGQGVILKGVRILQVMDTSTAADVLEAGDVIVAVGGTTVTDTTALATMLAEAQPGDTVTLALLRQGERMEVQARTGELAERPGRAVLGVQITDEFSLDLARAVDFRQYLVHEGGPSHGAMLALALIDQLTEGGVTYGNQVAGTGTIDRLGRVGRIGGIKQKAFTVARTGVDVFFVPAGQETEARKGSSDLNIVPVNTLADVLEWLRNHPKQQ